MDIKETVIGSAPENAEDTSPVEAPAPVENHDDENNFTSRFAALAKQEKSIRDREKSWGDSSKTLDEYKEFQALVKDNPAAVLERFGISLDDLIVSAMGEDAPPVTTESEIEKLRKEMEDLKSGIENKEKDEVQGKIDADKAADDKHIKDFKTEISSIIDSNQDKYELIKSFEAEDLVWEVVVGHYETHNEMLSPEDAAMKVETHLTETFRKSNKFNNAPKEPVEDKAPEFKKESVTLTNDYSAPASVTTRVFNSIEDSKRSAAKLIKWDR